MCHYSVRYGVLLFLLGHLHAQTPRRNPRKPTQGTEERRDARYGNAYAAGGLSRWKLKEL